MKRKRNGTAEGPLVLSHKELCFIRLKIHGLSEAEIRAFMEVEELEFVLIKAQIEQKFNSSNMLEIISKAIDYGHIQKRDYIEDDVKAHALTFSTEIFENFLRHGQQNHSGEVLKNHLKDFLNSCIEASKKKFKTK